MITPEWTDARTLLLPVEPADWPPPGHGVELDGVRFAPKDELHVTVIGNAMGRELRTVFGDPADALREAIDRRPWDFQRSGRTLLLRKRFVEEGHARFVHSIIELVELPAMAPFYRELERLLGRQLPLPPAHVTLYTAGRAEGIGVSSEARLRAFTVREVPIPLSE